MRPEKSERPSREGRSVVSYNESNSEEEDEHEANDFKTANADSATLGKGNGKEGYCYTIVSMQDCSLINVCSC